MDGLTGCAPYGADREGLWHRFVCAVIALCPALLDDLDLTIVTGSATFYQRDIRRQTHPVDMSPRIEVVQCVKDEVKGCKPVNIEASFLDVGMVCFDGRLRPEFLGDFFGDLSESKEE